VVAHETEEYILKEEIRTTLVECAKSANKRQYSISATSITTVANSDEHEFATPLNLNKLYSYKDDN
jgi:hypothetical protein